MVQPEKNLTLIMLRHFLLTVNVEEDLKEEDFKSRVRQSVSDANQP